MINRFSPLPFFVLGAVMFWLEFFTRDGSAASHTTLIIGGIFLLLGVVQLLRVLRALQRGKPTRPLPRHSDKENNG